MDDTEHQWVTDLLRTLGMLEHAELDTYSPTAGTDRAGRETPAM